MDVAAGVSTLAARQTYVQCDIAILNRHRYVAECSRGVHTAGAAHVQFAFGLRVQVQQRLALQPAALERKRTVHTGLFVHGEECLQRRMNDILVSQNSHSRSHAYAVVGTEGGTVGSHPFTVVLNVGLDRVFLEVKHAVAVLLRHHIHVSLQDHARMVLVTR